MSFPRKKILAVAFTILSIVGYGVFVFAAAPSGGYAPGATLDPDCAPGDANCFVQTGGIAIGNPIGSGIASGVLYTDSNDKIASDTSFTRNPGTLTNIADSFITGQTSSVQLNPNILGFGIKGAELSQSATNGDVGGVFTGDATSMGASDAAVGIISKDTVGDQVLALFDKNAGVSIEDSDGSNNNGALTLTSTLGALSFTNSHAQTNAIQVGSFGLQIVHSGSVIGTLPTADGTVGQVLTTNGVGGWTFQNPALGNVTGSATAGQITYWNGTSGIAGNANFLFNPTSDRFQVSQASGLGIGMVIDPDADRYVIGDYGGNANHQQFVLDDSAKLTSLSSPNGTVQLGDVFSSDGGNGTSLTINDTTQSYLFSKPNITIGTASYVFPAADPTSGAALITDGAGNLSWTIPTAAAGGSDQAIQFNSGGLVNGTNSLTWDGAALRVHGTDGLYIENSSNTANGFHFLTSNTLVPEVDFDVSGRRALFGYDGNVGRATFYSDGYQGGVYIYNTQGIAIGTNPLGYSGNALYIEQPVHGPSSQVYTASGVKFGVGVVPTDDFTVSDTAAPNDVASFTNQVATCLIDPTTSSLSCSSDERLKKNITDVSSTTALSQVLQLQGVTFNWNPESDTTTPHIGFIAQQVQQIFPQFVTTDSKGYLGVSYGSFAPVLVESIKALNLKITDIQNFATATDTTFLTNLENWLASATNGIKQIYADTFIGKEVDTSTLCVTDSTGAKTCITKSQLDQLLTNENGSSSTTSSSTSSGSTGSGSTSSSSGTTSSSSGGTVVDTGSGSSPSSDATIAGTSDTGSSDATTTAPTSTSSDPSDSTTTNPTSDPGAGSTATGSGSASSSSGTTTGNSSDSTNDSSSGSSSTANTGNTDSSGTVSGGTSSSGSATTTDPSDNSTSGSSGTSDTSTTTNPTTTPTGN